jgi:hypothetical protein
MQRVPDWARDAGDLTKRFRCTLNGTACPHILRVSKISPDDLLYCLQNQPDARPHLQAGRYVDKRNGQKHTIRLCGSHSVANVWYFAENNNGRRWVSKRETLYFYVIEEDNERYGNFIAVPYYGGLDHLKWYTTSDLFVKPSECFKATPAEDGTYTFVQVPLDGITCHPLGTMDSTYLHQP